MTNTQSKDLKNLSYHLSKELLAFDKSGIIEKGIKKAMMFITYFYYPKHSQVIFFDINDCNAIAQSTNPRADKTIFEHRFAVITFCRKAMKDIDEFFVAIFIAHELMHGVTGFGFLPWRKLIKELISKNDKNLLIPKGYSNITVKSLEIEDKFGRGSKGAHWKESTIGKELMTSLIGGKNEDPYLLPFTIKCVEKLGHCNLNQKEIKEIFEDKKMQKMKEIIQFIEKKNNYKWKAITVKDSDLKKVHGYLKTKIYGTDSIILEYELPKPHNNISTNYDFTDEYEFELNKEIQKNSEKIGLINSPNDDEYCCLIM